MSRCSGIRFFWRSLGRTFLIVGIAVPLEFLLGLGLAFLFMEKFPGKRIFYSLYAGTDDDRACRGRLYVLVALPDQRPHQCFISALIGQPFVSISWLSSGDSGDHRRHYRRGVAVDAPDVPDHAVRADGTSLRTRCAPRRCWAPTSGRNSAT